MTTLSLALLASHSSQNSSPFPVSLLLLHDLRNVVVNMVVPVDFDFVLVGFETVLIGFEITLVDFEILPVDFNSDTCPLLLH